MILSASLFKGTDTRFAYTSRYG